ncbi:MAG: MBL fold metallo-hydrolase [Xanthomonadales bacterium]|nr:MBL fold metallo-hydrolase [Xanthomonadales bacterium]
MTDTRSHLPPLDLGHGITRIDTGLNRPGMAACYLLQSEGRGALVDSGTWHSVPHILQVVEESGLKLDAVDYVIPTHIHLDHAGGAGELMRRLPRARMIVHPFGAKHMIDPQRITQGAIAVYGEDEFRRHYHEIVPVDAGRVIEAPDGFEAELGHHRLQFFDTPGHAGHHFCVWDAQSRGFFTGDTFGISYRETDVDGRPMVFPTTTPVQFKPEAWLESLDKLESFAPEVMYLTHFGAVRDVPRLMADLRDGITAYHDIARRSLDAADPESEIRAAIERWFLETLDAHGIVWPRERFEDILALDIDLNTQGLLSWQARNRA